MGEERSCAAANLLSNANAVHSLSSLETAIVVDLGCVGWERNGRMEDSIFSLVKRFKPAVLFGFDPHPALTESVGKVHGTTVVTSRKAAWTFSGRLGLEVNGNCTHVCEEGRDVECFDLAAWLQALPDVGIVLKMDVEGAEYVLLPYLIEWGVIERVSRLLVEFHMGDLANGYESDVAAIVGRISCPVEEWQ